MRNPLRWLRMSGDRVRAPGLFADLLAIAAVVILTTAVVRQRGEMHDLLLFRDAALELQQKEVLRANLFGRRVPSEALSYPSGAAVTDLDLADFSALWVVEPDDCVNCVSAAQEWNRSVFPEYPPVATVLSGVEVDAAAETVRRLGLRTPVLVDATGELRRRFGLLSPSTYLIVQDGEIIFLDSATPDRSCAMDILLLTARIFPPAPGPEGPSHPTEEEP